MNSHGQYEDYRTNALFYSTDKKKAKQWCKDATEHARKQDAKREKLMRKLSNDLTDEGWNKIYDASEKVKSKYDKGLSPSNLSDVTYFVIGLKELK
jgi:L-asparaginase/Glu-tRNA(Gln) amidotransferase subunit D